MTCRFLSDTLRERFGTKVYKLALRGGRTCPNRDGTVGMGGCIFCAEAGAGEFVGKGATLSEELADAKSRVAPKLSGVEKPLYIAYFQSFCATYLPVEEMRERFFGAIEDPEVAVLSVATRPDCLPPEVLELLGELAKRKPVWVELGLQTACDKTAERIRRGYGLSVYDRAVADLKAVGCEVITHMIVGLPEETAEDAVQTARHIAAVGSDGIKIHLLHVDRGTELETMYQSGLYTPMSLEEYGEILCRVLESLPPDMTVHRITGDGDKRTLVAPLWSGDKKRVMNYLAALLKERGLRP